MPLLACGEAWCQYLLVTRSAGPRLVPSERQQFLDAALRFLSVREAAGLPWTPKMHLMLHLVHQSNIFGNPLHMATWVDEGLNRQLAEVCHTAHASIWEKRVLATFNHELGPIGRASTKRKAERR